MSDPHDITAPIVNPETIADFMAERKRLREVRMRWIEEHEKPQAMELRDREGKVIYSGGPFQVGQLQYEDDREYTIDAKTGYKRPELSFVPVERDKEQQDVDAQLHNVITEYNRFSGTEIRGQILSHKSDHPPIREGESHEDWFNRVTESYSKAAQSKQAGTGSAGAGTDDVRRAAADDPSREGPVRGAGNAVCAPSAPPANLDHDANADDSV